MQEHERESVNLAKGANPWWLKGYAGWSRVTTDQVICATPCELIYALLTAGQSASAVAFYNGENTTMPALLDLEAGASVSQELSPPEPILCDKGLYVDVDGNIKSLFVLWRPLEKGWLP